MVALRQGADFVAPSLAESGHMLNLATGLGNDVHKQGAALLRRGHLRQRDGP